jgi:hypothetical protein
VSDKDVKEKNYSTQTSRVVTHRTTIWASTCLSSQIGRDEVLSRVYGRRYSLSYIYGIRILVVIPVRYSTRGICCERGAGLRECGGGCLGRGGEAHFRGGIQNTSEIIPPRSPPPISLVVQYDKNRRPCRGGLTRKSTARWTPRPHR